MSVEAGEVTATERAVVLALAAAWDLFLELPVEHRDDQAEFRHAIHQAQRMVLARVGARLLNGTAIGESR